MYLPLILTAVVYIIDVDRKSWAGSGYYTDVSFRSVPGASGDALLRANSPPRTCISQPQAFTTVQPTSTPNPSQTQVLRSKARYANAVLTSNDIPPPTNRVFANVSHGNVTTRLRCGGMFHNDFIANLPLSLSVKEF